MVLFGIENAEDLLEGIFLVIVGAHGDIVINSILQIVVLVHVHLELKMIELEKWEERYLLMISI